MTETKAKPIEIRDGRIRAAIWTNQGEKGKFYSVTLERTYTAEENGQKVAKSSSSFSGTELLQAQQVLGRAYKLIRDMQQADYETQQPEPAQG